MGKSFRKAIIKDKGLRPYWRPIRSKINQLVRMGVEDLPNEKTIINDYDYSDYRFTPEFDTVSDYRYSKNPEEDLKKDKAKYSRK